MHRSLRYQVALFLGLGLLGATGAPADEVILRDGERLTGDVLSLDREELLLRLAGGDKRHVPRDRVARIEFSAPEEVPPIRVELRNMGSDDALDLWLNGEPIFENSPSTHEWLDVTDRLRDGSNEVRFAVRNARGIWAYRWGVRIRGKTTILECGRPPRLGCSEEGFTGNEKGTIGPLPSVWIYVDRREGLVDLDR
jgi:hypothetical protein